MVEFKRASISDVKTLTDLGQRTFIETFSKDNNKKDMDLYVAETFNSEKQLCEIQDSNRFIEIVWINEQPSGFLHLLNGTADSSVNGNRPIEILRLYVDSKWHGKGVGAGLMDRSLQIAKEQGFQTVWLGVWERNLRAQAFYQKYGFEVVGQHIFRLGNDEQIDLIMARKI